MAETDRMLQKLVALKRQKAEQRVWALQQDLEKTEAALAELVRNLQATDNPALSFAACRLARQQGHVERVIAEIADLRVLISRKERELAEARDALRRTFHSEDRLRRAAN